MVRTCAFEAPDEGSIPSSGTESANCLGWVRAFRKSGVRMRAEGHVNELANNVSNVTVVERNTQQAENLRATCAFEGSNPSGDTNQGS
jgi:hypothetical protein